MNDSAQHEQLLMQPPHLAGAHRVGQGPTLVRHDRGLSLGWRLGLLTTLIVAAVLGPLLWYQRQRDAQVAQATQNQMLAELVMPLITQLEKAGSQEELSERLAAVQRELTHRQIEHYHFAIWDEHGHPIPDMGGATTPPFRVLAIRVALPFANLSLPDGRGQLMVWRDDNPLNVKRFGHRWLWLFDVVITAVCIIGALQLAYFLLIARPMRQLRRAFRRMELGYYPAAAPLKGPKEIRWMASRLDYLGRTLEETMFRLLQAERRALIDRPPAAQPGKSPWPGSKIDGIKRIYPSAAQGTRPAPPAPPDVAARLDYLRSKCQMLEELEPGDPAAADFAREVWEQDALEAERLRAPELRAQLEDAALRNLKPEGYFLVKAHLEQSMPNPEPWMAERAAQITDILAAANVPTLFIQQRIKNTASIWRKMQAKGLPLEQVHDIFGFRVIVPEEHDCYHALNAVHQRYRPLLLRFKDYIAQPKPNGYRSIHTCVRADDGTVFEIQIRTAAMHEQASGGPASHAYYKQVMNSDTIGKPARKLRREGNRGAH